MTRINLINGFFIEGDEFDYTLKQEYIGKTKDGKEKRAEKVIGYFSKLEQVVDRFLYLNNIDKTGCLAVEFYEYVNLVKESNKEAVRAITSLLEVADI